MSYTEQAAAQRETVKKLNDELSKNPSDEIRAKLIRESDLLAYLENASKGDPAGRAKRAARRARAFVTARIVS